MAAKIPARFAMSAEEGRDVTEQITWTGFGTRRCVEGGTCCIDCGNEVDERIRRRETVAVREQRDHCLVAVSIDLCRDVDLVIAADVQLDDAALPVRRVCDEELEAHRTRHGPIVVSDSGSPGWQRDRGC